MKFNRESAWQAVGRVVLTVKWFQLGRRDMKTTGKRTRASLKGNWILPLLFLGLASHTSTTIAQSPGAFTPTGEMTTARLWHTATLLRDGKVLIAGGVTGSVDSITATAELYDPVAGMFAATGDMTTPRRSHTATLLPDGRVLIAGGRTAVGSIYSAELYDPSTGTFTATGNMITAQSAHTATLLGNGKVLIAGDARARVARAELYDPASGTFSTTGTYASTNLVSTDNVCCPSATLLPDGRVLIAWPTGGLELYDPGAGTFSLTGNMTRLPFETGPATLLTSGNVLFAGGNDDPGESADAEVYDPSTGTFTATGNMTAPRADHTATLLPDGTVLIAGSQGDGGKTLASAELYDPVMGTFSAAGDMATDRGFHTATLLNNGKVLIAGGIHTLRPYPPYAIQVALSSAELYNSPLLAPAPVLTLDSTSYCIGASWSLRVTNAAPNTFARLLGTSNGESWQIPQWRKTDANGSFSTGGTFAGGTEGSYALSVEIGGVFSNAIFFVVSNRCKNGW